MSTTAVTSDGSPIFDVVQSWGVASARHTSGCLVYPLPSPIELTDEGDKQKILTISSSSPPLQDSCVDTEYLFDVPIGPSIVRWDFQTRRRVLQFQAHCDVVTSMRMSPDRRYIATSCFSGEVKLWSPQWVCLDHVTAPMSSQHHVGEILFSSPTPNTYAHKN
jgi:WD40 repeat protein